MSEHPSSAKGMSVTAKLAVVAALVAAVAVVLALKSPSDSAASTTEPSVTTLPVATARLPRLIELGSTTCVPCKMMAPILDELRKEYSGILQVDSIDVNQDREAATQYGIRVIPTQVFLDSAGKELFRHEGFFPKEDILAKWAALGVTLKPAASSQGE